MSRPGFSTKLLAGVSGALISTGVLLWSYRAYVQFLGYETFGLWLLVTTVVTLLQIGNVGVNPALAKLVAEELADRNLEGARAHIRTALAAVALSSTVLAGIALLGMPEVIEWLAMAQSSRDFLNALVPWVAVLSAYASIVDTYAVTLSGCGRIDLLHWCQASMTVTTATVSVCLLHMGVGMESLVIGQAAGYVTLHMASALCSNRILGGVRLLGGTPQRASLDRLYTIGRNLIGNSVIQLFFVPINRVILAHWSGPAAVSIYELAHNGSMRFRNLFETGLRAVMPEVSRLAVAGHGERPKIAALHERALMILLLGITPVYVCVWVATPQLIALWLGSSASPALSGALRVGLVGSLISLAGVPAFYVLLGMGKTQPLLIEKALHLGVSMSLTLGCLLSFNQVNPLTMLLVGAGGMSASTVYLLWSYRRAMRTVTCDIDRSVDTTQAVPVVL